MRTAADHAACDEVIAHLRERVEQRKIEANSWEAAYDRLASKVGEAAALLDFEANLGPLEHQATLREVVRQLTAALSLGGES